jgi:hypothetical protein
MTTKKLKNRKITFRLDDIEFECLEILRAKNCINVSALLRNLLRTYISDNMK